MSDVIIKKREFVSSNPKLMSEWHPTKNGDLKPNDFSLGSSKKVWWQCDKSSQHVWEAVIEKRTKGHGCPFCAGKRACTENSLQSLNPEIAKEWHPSENGDLTPDKITAFSNKKAWWICVKGHKYHASINSRMYGRGCPFCSGKQACSENSLQTLHPELAKDWHPEKNGILTPDNVTPGSHKKVWWQCNKRHEWQSYIYNRVKGQGCPDCSYGTHTSFPEQALYYYLKNVFDDTANRYKFDSKLEIDIFIPCLNICIEYDGFHFHKDNDRDLKKEMIIIEAGFIFIRVKETERSNSRCYRNNNVIYCSKDPSEMQLNGVIRELFLYITQIATNVFHIPEINVKQDRLRIYEMYIKGVEKDSLFIKYPKLAKQWHPTKNLNITPSMVKAGSDKVLWWLCEQNPEHEYDAPVSARVRGNGCPYCAGKRINDSNSLQKLYPDLAKQWHPTKNGDLTPNNITLGSSKKVWWICEQNPNHEYDARVPERVRGTGCPFCAGQRVSESNSLQSINPVLAKQWHPTKNGELTPSDVTSGSGKIVWWQCEKNHEHEWKARILNRQIGHKCPFCTGRKVSKDNCLQMLYPGLSKQWHSTKNGVLTPNDFTPGSDKKVWWKCDEEHEWDATIASRAKGGNGCPYCSGRRKT